MQTIVTILLWFAVLSVGLMAGVYYAFSAFVMRSLDALERPAAMLAMQSINRAILRSSFLPLFLASSAACAVLFVIGMAERGAAGAGQMAAGGAVYVAGMPVVTMLANVPLNNALEATAAAGPEGAAMWERFMRRWMPWNHVRTGACTLSLALLVWAIAARGAHG